MHCNTEGNGMGVFYWHSQRECESNPFSTQNEMVHSTGRICDLEIPLHIGNKDLQIQVHVCVWKVLVCLQQPLVAASLSICAFRVVALIIGVLSNCIRSLLHTRHCGLSDVWILFNGDCAYDDHLFLRNYGDMEWSEGVLHRAGNCCRSTDEFQCIPSCVEIVSRNE